MKDIIVYIGMVVIVLILLAGVVLTQDLPKRYDEIIFENGKTDWCSHSIHSRCGVHYSHCLSGNEYECVTGATLTGKFIEE